MKTAISFIGGLVCLFCLSTWALSATYYVNPTESIQDAIDSATDGDTVVLMPGIYKGNGNRDIDFRGKAITVTGTNPEDSAIVAATVIDCDGAETEPHRAFVFKSGEDTQSVISGITITDGFGSHEPFTGLSPRIGGGILCYSSSPTIKNCTIRDSSVGWHGGSTRAGAICYVNCANAVMIKCIS